MKAIFTFFILTVFYCIPVNSQDLHHSSVPEGFMNKAPSETIFVHHNSAVIFPGEYFLYSVYNLENSTGQFSHLSKVAYVELLGEKGQVVFRQKVKLENGRGNADFFIPTSVPSGNYKLLAYTNWMRNFEKSFFESDITLVNPYQSTPRKLLEENPESNYDNETPVTYRRENNSGNSLTLNLNKNSFGKRDQVRLNISSNVDGALNGEYSLSVRKKESLPYTNSPSATTVSSVSKNPSAKNSETLKLPELRGQIVSGRLSSKAATSLENKVIALSIPSKEGFAQLATTNKDGQFFFNLEPDVRINNAVLEVISNELTEFNIEADNTAGIDPSNVNFAEFTLTPEMKDVILQRSIYNQIENAFFAVKPDTLVPQKNELSLPGTMVETYQLDDYTRFKSMPETFVEIIKSAWVRKNAAGDAVFQVRGLMNYVDMGLLPLVMIDGILVQNHEIAAMMDARRIKSIKIIRDKIILGPASFQGAVLFETVNGDFVDQYNAPNTRKIDLFNPQVPKKYFRQVYTAENINNRIPDFRYQLHWEPNLDLKARTETIEFFTSDVNGEFEIVLQGFTTDGKPVSIREYFTVE